MTFSGMSAEKAWRSRSCGDGMRGSSSWPAASAGGEDGGAFAAASSSSVLRNSAASGPSRMLALSRLLLAISEDLLGELPIRVCGGALRVVLEHRHALHGRLGEADGLLDAGREDLVAEVLLEQLDRLLGMEGAGIH